MSADGANQSAPSGLRLTVYDLEVSATSVSLPEAVASFVYVLEGSVSLSSNGQVLEIAAEHGHMIEHRGSVSGAGSAWLYVLSRVHQALADDPALSLVISRVLPRTFAGPAIFRADRVASDAGAQTPLHGHRGPGIRRLVSGLLEAQIGDDVDRIEAGQAWFETGTDWVVGRNISVDGNVFVRAMVLPAELMGGISSFVSATPAESAKPRAARYALLGECAVPAWETA